MAYPETVSSTMSEHVPYSSKPILRGTAIYKSLYGGTTPNFYIAMMKSTDAGVTWTEQDSGNHPGCGRGSYNCIGTFDDGTDIWFAYCPDGASPPSESRVIRYIVSSDTWDTAITGGPLPVTVSGLGTTSANPSAQLNLVVRSNGDIVLVHTDNLVSPFDRHSLKFSVYASAAWGSPVDLMEPGTSDSSYSNYCLTGLALGANDLVHVFAWSDIGLAYATIDDTDTVANYRVFDEDSALPSVTGPRLGCYWGQSSIITLCSSDFAVSPVGMTTAWEGNSDTFLPMARMVYDADPVIGDTLLKVVSPFTLRTNWLSVAICQDASDGSIYLVWPDIAVSGDADIKRSCFKGLNWTAPVTLFSTTWATHGAPETLEASVASGTLRITFQYTGNVYYWQGSVTCSAAGCAASEGNINAVA